MPFRLLKIIYCSFHYENMGGWVLNLLSDVPLDLFLIKILQRTDPSVLSCRSIFYQWDPGFEFMGTSFLKIFDSLWTFSEDQESEVRMFFGSKIIDQVRSRLEITDSHLSVHTLCNRLPTYLFLYRTTLRPTTLVDDTISLLHSQLAQHSPFLFCFDEQNQNRIFLDLNGCWQASFLAWCLDGLHWGCVGKQDLWLVGR